MGYGMANLITVEEYEVFDNTPSPIENTAQIEQAITSAMKVVEAKAGRTFELIGPSPVDIVEVLDGKGVGRLFVHNTPLVTITKIEYWSGTLWYEYELVTCPYTFKPGSNAVYFTEGHKFFKGYQNIRITYSYGYTAFPDDLRWACYAITKYFVDQAERQGISSQQDGEQNFSYKDELPIQAVKTIMRYKTGW